MKDDHSNTSREIIFKRYELELDCYDIEPLLFDEEGFPLESLAPNVKDVFGKASIFDGGSASDSSLVVKEDCASGNELILKDVAGFGCS